MSEFSEHVAMVTGAGSGIGQATAIGFAKAGAKVALLDLDERACRATADQVGDHALPLVVDITDDRARQEAVDSTIRAFGRLDHLVNVAASFINAGANGTREQWQRSLDVNVISSSLLTSAAATHMKPGSTVVNISSISAHVAQPGRWTYNSTKAAILALTRGQALDLASAGIRVNAVSPGWIRTPEVEKAMGEDRSQSERAWAKFHILGRLGEPEEVADSILFLSSTRASFITGSEVLVDGGYSAMGPEGDGSDARFAGSN